MKPFGQWVMEPEQIAFNPASPHEQWERAGGEFVNGVPHAYCRSCGELTEVYCEPEEFENDTHYCGGSPRCCP